MDWTGVSFMLLKCILVVITQAIYYYSPLTVFILLQKIASFKRFVDICLKICIIFPIFFIEFWIGIWWL